MPGHSLFGALYSVLDQRTPLLPKLYRQKKVCEKEGVAFKSKIELAVDTLATFEPLADTTTHVLVDSWFHCHSLRKACRKRGWDLSGELKSNRRLRVVNARGELEWQRLSDYASGLKEVDWQLAQWPSSAEGKPQTVYVHVIRTKVSKLGATLVVIRRYHLAGQPGEIRYWGTTVLAATAQEVLDCLVKRWSIEVFFEDAKDLLGSDHYQLMSAVGVERFWTLIALLSSFLDEERFKMSQGTEGAHHSWGECRNELQRQHRRNLLSWLEQQFREGAEASTLAHFFHL
ncbi:MAG: transposase [Chloroflexi bacterium]|uniref:Transposase n=1 Tax=Candidatus Chlorohelix allophototropha TaxID=3003348 RepID=A0A8T7M541_9CHLR|nr:transposase [Chloroflexota bacterium]WJW70281.1 transposase [Chloroflexota bacterium L227-S17]